MNKGSKKIKKVTKKTRKYDELAALKEKIRTEGSSYRQLSKDTGISTDALNNKINGYTVFDADEICSVANALDISAEELNIYFFPSLLRNAI